MDGSSLKLVAMGRQNPVSPSPGLGLRQLLPSWQRQAFVCPLCQPLCLRRLRLLLPKASASKACLPVLIFKLKDALNFHPIDNSVLSSLPITITFSLRCRLQTKTDTILVWGNQVEVPQGIHKAVFFFRRDRVGEQCSLLFRQLFQPHVF